ncbi:MAG: VCBS repeat-containing protein [Alphaproteobacteria bacterium]|nr:VCBS repeat-containing protein [Alphaproteobacteria bacterium]
MSRIVIGLIGIAVLVTLTGVALAEGGTLIGKQSFDTELAGFGKVRFVSLIDDRSGPGKCRFELRRGGLTVYRFPKAHANDWSCWEITAIAFADVNGDGRKDVIVMAKAITGIGPTGARTFNANTIYYNTGKGRFATVAVVNELASKYDHIGKLKRALAKSPYASIKPR